jgi:hypothetical protein
MPERASNPVDDAVGARIRLSYGGQNNAWGGPKTRANSVQAEGERNDPVAFLLGCPLVESLPVRDRRLLII